MPWQTSAQRFPLDHYQAGTEHTNLTLVGNGAFEAVAGGQPVGWTLHAPMGVGAPTGANVEHNGAFSARGVLTYDQRGWYERPIILERNEDYAVSAYMWAHGNLRDEAFIEVHDSAGDLVSELVLIPGSGSINGTRGVFMHGDFRSSHDGAMTIRVGAVAGPRTEPGGGNTPTLKGQIDNVAITPLAEFVPPQPGGGSATWNASGSGNWSAAGNWLGGVPDGIGATANFGSIITSAATVTLDSNRTVGSVNFNNANKYTIAGTNTLTFDVSGGVASMRVIDFGSHEIATPVQLNDNTDVTVSLAGSTLRLSGQVSAASVVTLTKRGPGLLEMRNVRTPALDVTSGTVRVLSKGTSAATSNVTTLSIDTGSAARLDVRDNAFVVDYTGSSSLTQTRDYIVMGYNGGAWDGPGVITSLGNAGQFALGYAEASALGGSVPAIFGSVDATAVLFRHTRYGDANLDGTVNLQDFNRLAAQLRARTACGRQGDFNYDGTVNLQDFNQLAAQLRIVGRRSRGDAAGLGRAWARPCLSLSARRSPASACWS